MSEPFTVELANLQATGMAEQLRLAYSERRYSSGGQYWRFGWNDVSEKYEWSIGDGTDADVLKEGVNLHCNEFWRQMQLLSDAWFSYRKPDEIIGGVPQKDYEAISFGSLDGFFEYAGEGLYDQETGEHGFRKASEYDQDGLPVFTRGNISGGDLIGPWIIEDIVSMFRALTRSATSLNMIRIKAGATSWYGESTAGFPSTPDERYQSARSNATPTTIPQDGSRPYTKTESTDFYYVASSSAYSYGINNSSGLAVSMDLYGELGFADISQNVNPDPLGELGLPGTVDEVKFVETVLPSGNSGLIGVSPTAKPAPTYNVTGPLGRSEFFYDWDPRPVIDWNFTNG